jgi:hypothetical protein
MPELTKAQLRAERHRWSKWWFDFIERFLMVGALNVAAKISSSMWLEIFYVVSLLYLGLWVNDCFEGRLEEFIPEETDRSRLWQYAKARGYVLRWALVAIVTIGTHVLLLEVSHEFMRASRPQPSPAAPLP